MNGEGWGYCPDASYPFHSKFRLSSCFIPQGCHVHLCLQPLSHKVLFSSLPDIFLCLGLPACPKEPFWHCSELISIPLVPENDLPVLLFNVSFLACLNFTHRTFCGKRKLESDSVFCFPPNQNRRLSRQVFQADAQYFPWQISHWLSKMSHWWCSGISSTPECHGIISLVVAIFHVYFHSPV